MGASRVGVVLIDFFSADRTIKYINESQDFFSGYKIDYVIVDNSCDRNNYEALCNELNCKTIYKESLEFEEIASNDNCYILKSKKNGGFAYSNNKGYLFLKKKNNYDYIIFSNSDIQFLPSMNLYDLIKCFYLDDKIAVIGPRVLGIDNKPQSPCKKMSIYERWWRTSFLWPFDRLLHLKDSNDLIKMDRSNYVYRIIGAFMVVRPILFENAGMFDENTFLYAEEPILSERLIMKGYKTFFCYDCTIIHESGYTTSIPKKLFNLKKIRRVFKSEMYYYKEYIGVHDFVIAITKVLFRFYCIKLHIANGIKHLLG